jgi:hypothetical protein
VSGRQVRTSKSIGKNSGTVVSAPLRYHYRPRNPPEPTIWENYSCTQVSSPSERPLHGVGPRPGNQSDVLPRRVRGNAGIRWGPPSLSGDELGVGLEQRGISSIFALPGPRFSVRSHRFVRDPENGSDLTTAGQMVGGAPSLIEPPTSDPR